jgi:hypothetical protein
MLMKSQTYIKLINFREGEGSSGIPISPATRQFEYVRPKLKYRIYFERLTLKHTIRLELVMVEA